MPRQRITHEMVVQAAFELARQGGMEAVRVKALAEKLGCSVQPVYSYCQSMDHLRREVTDAAGRYLQRYVQAHAGPDGQPDSMALAYIRFAKEEPHLYRLYFLREREDVRSLADVFAAEANPKLTQRLALQQQLSPDAARALHLHLMIYNTGLSFILSALGSHADIGETARLLGQAHAAFSGWIHTQNQKEAVP